MSIDISTILLSDLSASLASYNKNTALSFEEIRQQAWKKSINKKLLRYPRTKLAYIDTKSSLRGNA